jgi:hypothetical protein
LRTAIHRPMATSTVTFSMMTGTSSAPSTRRTGAQYKFQNRNRGLLLAVVLAS